MDGKEVVGCVRDDVGRGGLWDVVEWRREEQRRVERSREE